MRLLLALLVCLPLLGQQAQPLPAQAPPAEQKAAPAAAQAEKKEAEQPPAPAAGEQQPAAPVPAGEPAFTGSIDFGFRWSSVGGSFPTYRSIVNLNQGLKLFGADFTIVDPKKRLFDVLHVRGYNWGDDPYTTAHLDASKLGIYQLNFDYRNFMYYDNLPSFADPLLPLRGFFLDERAFDLRRRLADFNIDLRPGKRIIPYFAFNNASDQGSGIANLVLDVNEYPARHLIDDAQRNYRGGLRIELNRFHATLEQGGTTYGDSEQLQGINMLNYGNRTTPYLGQTLYAKSVLDAYHINGDSIYSRVLVTANPYSWIDLYGQFMYSQPRNNVTFDQNANGNFVLLSALLFYTGQSELGNAEAKLPHVTANFGMEFRPFKRLRIIESLMTDRMHNASAGVLTDQYFLGGALALGQTNPLNDRLVMNFNREEVDVLFDVLPRVTLRGGFRKEWGDADVRTPSLLEGFAPLESGQLSRKTGLAGLTYRPVQKLSTSIDFEGASSDKDYFRTSLHDYQQVRARARYQALTNFNVTGSFWYLNNENPDPGVNYEFQSRQSSLSLAWTPGGGKYVSIMGDYTRATMYSAMNFLIPQNFTSTRYIYRDNDHIATALVDLNLPKYAGLTPKISIGGSLFLSNGSRPTSYYQPYLRALIPLQKHVYWNTEWRYYGFGETFYLYEGFRAHLVQTGLRLIR